MGSRAKRHDPTHGRIDFDIQEHVDRMQEADGVIYPIAQRCAIENTLQDRRDRGRMPDHLAVAGHIWTDKCAECGRPVVDHPTWWCRIEQLWRKWRARRG